MKITDLAYARGTSSGQPPVIVNPWRADLQPARFRNAYFHTEGSGIDNGRRVVVHEFPKKDIPYAEDMGRRAYEFTVRGYCIAYVKDLDGPGLELYRRDYRIARDLLADALSDGTPGKLYLPTYKGHEIDVICPRYRLSEEERLGGFCTFDMTFVELGLAPTEPLPDDRDALLQKFQELRDQTVSTVQSGPGTTTPSATPSNGTVSA